LSEKINFAKKKFFLKQTFLQIQKVKQKSFPPSTFPGFQVQHQGYGIGMFSFQYLEICFAVNYFLLALVSGSQKPVFA